MSLAPCTALESLLTVYIHSMIIEQLQSFTNSSIALDIDYVDPPTSEEEAYYLNVIQPAVEAQKIANAQK